MHCVLRGSEHQPHPSKRVYLTKSVYQVVLQKKMAEQIRQLLLYTSDNQGYVDRSVGGLTFFKTTLYTFSVR